ncbi:MAG: sel1 repeat family protein [Pseudomonadales bacterium]|nr:sel1 repeat family protein [Pseudomonadales bacterium]
MLRLFFITITSLFIAFSSTADEANKSKAEVIQQQATDGLAEAQYILSSMYSQGYEVEKNLEKAFIWAKKSAEQGYAAAEFDVASMYDFGEGVDRNLEHAAQWYEKVAKKGEAAAAFNLATMYESGDGIPQDMMLAYAWFEAAAIMGFDDAKAASKRLVQQFDSETLAQADDKAAALINKLIKK